MVYCLGSLPDSVGRAGSRLTADGRGGCQCCYFLADCSRRRSPRDRCLPLSSGRQHHLEAARRSRLYCFWLVPDRTSSHRGCVADTCTWIAVFRRGHFEPCSLLPGTRDAEVELVPR